MGRILLFLVLLWMGAPAFAAPIIKADVQQKVLQPGDFASFKVLVVEDSTSHSNFSMSHLPEFSEALTDFDIIGRYESQSTNVQNQNIRVILTVEYQLRPKKTGELRIPAMTYTYQDQDKVSEVKSQPISVWVQAPASKSQMWFALGLVLLFLLGSFGALVSWARKWRKPRELKNQKPSEFNMTETALSFTGNLDEKVLGLQTEVKNRLGTHFMFDPKTKTTREILDILQGNTSFNEDHKNKISETLTRCDAHKFQPNPISEAEFDHLFTQMDQIFRISKNQESHTE